MEQQSRPASNRPRLAPNLTVSASPDLYTETVDEATREASEYIFQAEGIVGGSSSSSTPDESGSGRKVRSSITSSADLEYRKTIGRGSTGVVEKAFHRASNQFVAVKIIALDPAKDNYKQIATEIKTLNECRSPHIISIVSAFYQDASVYMVLEYMDGTLADITKITKRIPEHVMAKVAPQVLYGLLYLHSEMKVMHRDIKPSNLLVNYAGQVKISDFSVSGFVKSNKSRLESFVGTVTYMSPERLAGSNYSFDTDIWSLGLTFMECAQGNFPYIVSDTPGFYQIMDMIVESETPRLNPEKFSAEFVDFISGCMQKNPNARASIPQLLVRIFN
eukprot:TRINITY_DN2478_c0_g1_i1.p1 TRINITY_DN2478_c0_g1~~TRINITY_DN2478_c0_g1_i1.p1  ORF type:complete len:333 (-),score=71.02 TRINITY_DN2478_c0_g1_i1:707-1705(-)